MEQRKLAGKAKMMLIHIDEDDWYEGEPLYEAIVKTFRKLNIAGATVFRGIMGYGGHHLFHKKDFLGLSEDMPITIQVVDTQEKINQALPVLEKMMSGGLVTLSDVEVIKYKSE